MLEGVWPGVYQTPFGAWVQEVIDPASGLHNFRPDLVVLSIDWHDLVTDLSIGAAEEEVATALSRKTEQFRNMWQAISRRLGARIIQHVAIPPSARYRGTAERLAPASSAQQVRVLNDQLFEAGEGLVTWVDLEALANEIGTRTFTAPRHYHAAKLGFDPRFLPEYLVRFRSAWRTALGRTRKVLVLDLDNTLWGGVIGDDGVDGLSLGPGTADGEAFAEFQRYVKELAARGVVLAVCSKNNPEIAKTGFDHPHSRLKPSDFAAFECSWADKAGALRRIAQTLNVGTDSLVFADDNPAECALVRREIPEVAVVELDLEPSNFVAAIDAGGWFDLASYTDADLGRAKAYAARAAASEAAATATDLESYLTSLEMVGRLYTPPEADIARVAQLEIKTNQFNLTTRRYTEAAIREFLDRADAKVLAFRLSDRFGDHGLVSTLIAVVEDNAMRIDSWLMSCRVFSRTAEEFILQQLIRIARNHGVSRIIGEYSPTAKNDVVADLYGRLGFAPQEAGRRWLLELDRLAGDKLATYVNDA